jgi:DNA-binding response OmpR family regulator
MITRVETWPFISPHQRTPEEEERWWSKCHVYLPQEDVLRSHIEWTVVTGAPGSGKSTLLYALKRSEASTALILDNILPDRRAGDAARYGPLLWIMKASAQVFRQHFLHHPEHVEILSNSQREFLRWLIEKFLDPRSYVRWRDGLPPEAASRMEAVSLTNDLYPTQTEADDVHAQAEELLNLSRRIGYERIVVLVDVDYPTSADVLMQVSSLFDSLELMQHIGLRLVAAIPQVLLEKTGLLHKAKGRVHVLPTEITLDRMDDILQRHLGAASGGDITGIGELAGPELFARIKSLTTEFEMPSPKGLLGAVNILLECGGRQQIPLNQNLFAEIFTMYHKRNNPLRLNKMDEQRGVWRGQKFIGLKEGPYELLQALWRARGNPIDHRVLSSTKENFHTLARRLRVALEPDPGNPIYILNTRNEGYWLENFAGESVSGS